MHAAILLMLVICTLSVAQSQDAAPGEYQPKGPIREYFLGAWKLISTEDKYPDGHVEPFPDLGPDARGFLLYTPSGHMCAQLMRPGRPRWSDDSLPTANEAASASQGFTSYCGTFKVKDDQRLIVHHPETSWSPNWLGTAQNRSYYLIGPDRFLFRGTSIEEKKDGTKTPVSWTIVWERLK